MRNYAAFAIAVASPGLITAYFSFNAGGFFAGAPAVAATALGLALVLRITLVDEPFAGLSRPLVLAIAAFGLYAAWVLLSALWSDSVARALIEFDRALMYWLALLLFGSIAREDARLAWALRLLALTLATICAIGLATRLFPDVFTVDPGFARDRLSYPLTYWNAEGLFAALALIFCFHLTASTSERAGVRVAAAAFLPIVACALYFTFSRGGVVVAIAGLAVYLVLARQRGLVAATLTAVPTLAIALIAAYGADLVSSERPTSDAAVAQAHDVAVVVAIAVVAAAVLRLLLLRLDGALDRATVAPATRRRLTLGGLALGAVVAVVAVVGLSLPSRVADQYERFVEGDKTSEDEDLRVRFTDVSNNGRLDHWRIAVDEFEARPLAGSGAGTYGLAWLRERDDTQKVEDAHSLYLENLSELGLVGLALLLGGLGALLGGFLLRMREGPPAAAAALFAAGLAWAIAAGLDWNWEMPAVTFWLFALGGMALAARRQDGVMNSPSRFSRVVLAVGCLVLIVSPALMASSQANLNTAVAAFKQGDCAGAIDAALASSDAMPVRPEPLQVLGYCDARLGKPELAQQVFRGAIEREPENWQSWYGLAIARAAGGLDPRRALRRAERLNPLDPLTLDAIDRFDTDDPQKWKRRARTARLPIS